MRHRHEPLLQKGDTELPDGAAWQQFFPNLTGTEAKTILSRDLAIVPADITLRVDVTGYGYLETAHETFDEYRTFNLKNHIVDWGVIRVDQQEQGIFRRTLRNQLELFKAAGVTTFNIRASGTGGGYAAARMGFKPNDMSSEQFVTGTKARVEARFSALADLLTAPEKKSLKRAAALKKDGDLQTIADAPVDLGPRLKDLFAKSASGDEAAKTKAGNLLTVLTDSYFEPDSSKTAFNIKARAETDKPLPIGRLLLAGTYWDGHIDLNDEAQMKRAGEYAGGWSSKPSI